METKLNLFSCADITVKTPASEPGPLVSYSHFSEPIQNTNSSGLSRKWGDAPRETQEQVINTILSDGIRAGFKESGLAFLLSVARVESGFNPDAAATSTSASGLGQFIDKTGEMYGLNSTNRFDIKAGSKAFVKHIGEMYELAKKQLKLTNQEKIWARTYALYHDGPSLKYSGEEIALSRVLPDQGKILTWLRCQASQGD